MCQMQQGPEFLCSGYSCQGVVFIEVLSIPLAEAKRTCARIKVRTHPYIVCNSRWQPDSDSSKNTATENQQTVNGGRCEVEELIGFDSFLQ